MAAYNLGSKITKAGSFEIVEDEPEKREVRSVCPDCGSNNSVSNGSIRLICKSCGRTFSRFKHPRAKPDYINRPPCPRCGAYHSNIHSEYDYKCGECGRTFKKV